MGQVASDSTCQPPRPFFYCAGKMKDNGLRLEWRDASELEDNPVNWRRHPQSQKAALKDLLKEVGWAGALLYNEATHRLIDGHLRKEVARGQKVPVLVGSWTEAQEREILATLDPVAAMARPDQDALIKLLAQVETGSQAVKDLLEALANGENLSLPELGPELDESLAEGVALCTCPECGNEHARTRK